jgi:predicted AAA+ superfamily ATPase
MIQRHLTANLIAALRDTPVVLLHGARQTGKSTLVRELARTGRSSRYLTLDDAVVLSAARSDPAGFLAGIQGPVVIDEVQRAPDLFLTIKAEVDRNRKPGRFLLTGSANVLLIPQLAESLAGRMEIQTLWPFSQGEIAGVKEGIIDAAFARKPLQPAGSRRVKFRLSDLLLTGGYPPAIARPSLERRQAWFGSYITTILERDVRDLANVEALASLPRLLSLVAARTGTLLNFAELSRSAAIPQSTLKRYFSLFETTFLVQLTPAWSTNLSKRLVKAPKVHLVDTGLASYLLGLDASRLALDPTLRGPLLESFVTAELTKQAAWSRRKPRLFHFRQSTGQEVDLVLEDLAGYVVGIEVKASATVNAQDFNGLRTLSEIAANRFRCGIVFYTGATVVSFGANFHALPLPTLWAPLKST